MIIYCYDEDEHRREGERDARYGRNNYDYDRYSDDPCHKAYFSGYHAEERRIEERRQEERHLEEEAEARYYASREREREELSRREEEIQPPSEVHHQEPTQ